MGANRHRIVFLNPQVIPPEPDQSRVAVSVSGHHFLLVDNRHQAEPVRARRLKGLTGTREARELLLHMC